MGESHICALETCSSLPCFLKSRLSQNSCLWVQLCFFSPPACAGFKSRADQYYLIVLSLIQWLTTNIQRQRAFLKWDFWSLFPHYILLFSSNYFTIVHGGRSCTLWIKSNSSAESLWVKGTPPIPRCWPPVISFWNPKTSVGKEDGLGSWSSGNKKNGTLGCENRW